MESEIRKYCKHILKVHIEVLRRDKQKGYGIGIIQQSHQYATLLKR